MALFSKKETKIPGVPEDFGDVLALLDGRKPTNDDRVQLADGSKLADILPVATRIAAAQNGNGGGNGRSRTNAGGLSGAFAAAAGNIDPRTLQIGQLVDGKGVYVGVWEPTDSNGRTLGQTFDLYAAPEDVRKSSGDNLLMTFNDAVRHVAGLRNWHGHDGANFENAQAVMQAVRSNPGELGKWFIPTKEILHGKNAQGNKVQNDNLFDHRSKMPRGSEFVTTDNGSDFAHWYWSCTERPGNSSLVYSVGFTDGGDGWDDKDHYELSTRPVRAELRL